MDRSRSDGKLGSALGAGALQLLLGYVFLLGLSVHASNEPEEDLQLFDVGLLPPPPAPRIEPPKVRSQKPEGLASPANIRSKASEIVAPPPEIRLPTPPPLIAAPIAGRGSDPSAGASDVPGPGTGSGGLGDGTGGGGYGDGDGGGGEATPPRRIKGRLKNSDYPRTAGEMGVGGTVSVRYTVATDGRVTHCAISASSGNAILDETTCRLIEQRFRFEPSRDADGRAVRSIIVENHSWVIHQLPPEPPQEVRSKRRFPF